MTAVLGPAGGGRSDLKLLESPHTETLSQLLIFDNQPDRLGEVEWR